MARESYDSVKQIDRNMSSPFRLKGAVFSGTYHGVKILADR